MELKSLVILNDTYTYDAVSHLFGINTGCLKRFAGEHVFVFSVDDGAVVVDRINEVLADKNNHKVKLAFEKDKNITNFVYGVYDFDKKIFGISKDKNNAYVKSDKAFEKLTGLDIYSCSVLLDDHKKFQEHTKACYDPSF